MSHAVLTFLSHFFWFLLSCNLHFIIMLPWRMSTVETVSEFWPNIFTNYARLKMISQPSSDDSHHVTHQWGDRTQATHFWFSSQWSRAGRRHEDYQAEKSEVKPPAHSLSSASPMLPTHPPSLSRDSLPFLSRVVPIFRRALFRSPEGHSQGPHKASTPASRLANPLSLWFPSWTSQGRLCQMGSRGMLWTNEC